MKWGAKKKKRQDLMLGKISDASITPKKYIFLWWYNNFSKNVRFMM